MSVTRSGAWVSPTRTGRFLVVVPTPWRGLRTPRGIARAAVVLAALAALLGGEQLCGGRDSRSGSSADASTAEGVTGAP